MTRSNAAHEPSMDEILASIRRIIESGDGPEPAATSRPRPERAPHVERLEPGAESAANVVARLTPEPSPAEAPEISAPEALPEAGLPEAEPEEPEQPELAATESVEPPSALAEIEFSTFELAEEDELAARLRDDLSDEDLIDWSALTAALADETGEDGAVGKAPEIFAVDRPVADVQAPSERLEAAPARVMPTLRPSAAAPVPHAGAAIEEPALAALDEETPEIPVAAAPNEAARPEMPFEAPFVAANSDSRRMQEFRAAVLDDLEGKRQPDIGSLTSGRTGELVGAAFDDLAEAIRDGQMRSMEEMAQDLLRPMLQDWLDENLPKLVERLVREEIERVARGGRR